MKCMLKPATLFTILFSFQILSGQDLQKQNINIIKSLRNVSNECIAKRDADGLSVNYLEDYVLITGNGSQLIGKDTVMVTWKEMFKSIPEISFVRTPTEISINEQILLAWETGNWTGVNTYSKGGNYSAMWRHTNSGWKLQAELFVALK